jgi:enamine deaminase RidA (YjgF/YER057c/UK114 family)
MAPTFRPATKTGDSILLSGMVGRGPDGKVAAGLVTQTQLTLGRIERTLETFGKGRKDIARLRIYLTDITSWPAVRSELEAFFGPDCPSCTVVGVVALVEPEMLIEIDTDAQA